MGLQLVSCLLRYSSDQGSYPTHTLLLLLVARSNVLHWAEYGVVAQWVPIGYTPGLASSLAMPVPEDHKQYDVVFIGKALMLLLMLSWVYRKATLVCMHRFNE